MKKYTSRKRTYRSRRTGLRRIKRSYNIAKGRGPRAHYFKKTVWSGNWTPGTGSTSAFWQYRTVTPTTLSNWTEYQSLFDQYKLHRVKVTFRPRYDSFAGNDTTDVTLPGITNQAGCYVHIINDPTSALTPSGTYVSTTLNAFMENGNVKTYQGNKPFSVYFKPMIDVTISGGNQRRPSPWLQCKDNSVVHNGFHAFMQDINMTGTFGQSFDLFTTFYFSCRGMN